MVPVAMRFRAGSQPWMNITVFPSELAHRKWAAFVVALIESIFPAMCSEVSGLISSLPGFQTAQVSIQVASLAFLPPKPEPPAILACNLHACRVGMTFSVVAAFERLVAAGTVITAALSLDRSSSSLTKTRRAAGGLWDDVNVVGGIGGNTILIAIRTIIGLRGAQKRAGAVRAEVSFERVHAEEGIRRMPSSGTRSGHMAKSPTRGMDVGSLRRPLPRRLGLERLRVHRRCVQQGGREGIKVRRVFDGVGKCPCTGLHAVFGGVVRLPAPPLVSQ